MTPSEAYTADPTFRELIREWVRHKRCPIVLVDRCLELDMPKAAECARWCATQPERKQYCEYGFCGPFPAGFSGHDYPWWCTAADYHNPHANVVPLMFLNHRPDPRGPLAEDACVALLAAWAHDTPQENPPWMT